MTIERISRREKTDHGLDEIVADNIWFHFERMDHNHVWFAIRDGNRWVSVHLQAKGTIKANLEDQRLSDP